MGITLVTGAGGFIGRALVEHLLAGGDEVVAVGRRAGAPRAGVTWHPQDLAEQPTLPRALLAGVERVFLLAAMAHRGPPRDAAGQAALRRLNVEHPAAVARQAAAAGVQRLVFLSSIGAMGSSGSQPFTPDTPCRPTTDYGRSKLASETALRQIAGETGLPLAILRPPLVIGPGAPGNLPRLIARARAGRPLPRGTLANRRSLVGLTGLVAALDLVARHPDAVGQTFLVAEPPPLSTGALYQRLAQSCGRPARFLPVPTAPLDWLLRRLGRGATADGLFRDLVIDDPRLRQLGWQPGRSLDEEIRRAAHP